MAYKDKDRQKQANRAAAKRYRAGKQGMTLVSETVIPEQSPTVIPGDRALLESWAKGEGSTYQRSLGILAMKYSQIHGVDWPGSQEIMDADSVWCRGVRG